MQKENTLKSFWFTIHWKVNNFGMHHLTHICKPKRLYCTFAVFNGCGFWQVTSVWQAAGYEKHVFSHNRTHLHFLWTGRKELNLHKTNSLHNTLHQQESTRSYQWQPPMINKSLYKKLCINHIKQYIQWLSLVFQILKEQLGSFLCNRFPVENICVTLSAVVQKLTFQYIYLKLLHFQMLYLKQTMCLVCIYRYWDCIKGLIQHFLLFFLLCYYFFLILFIATRCYTKLYLLA